VTPNPGRRRKATGDSAEARVDAIHAACRLAGVASLHRIPTEVVVQRRGARIVGGFHRRRATVDYTGVMLDGTGRHVAVEVKSVAPGKTGTTLPLRVLEPHQREALTETDAAGGVAVVLVVSGPKVYAIPWCVVAAAIEAGDASLRMPEWCEPGLYLERWMREATSPDELAAALERAKAAPRKAKRKPSATAAALAFLGQGMKRRASKRGWALRAMQGKVG